MHDRVLVTGGTGKTGRSVAEQLAFHGADARIATRRPSAADHVRFDWEDTTTHAPALDGVSSVYLVAPTDRAKHLPVMLPFLEQAVARVPGRLVLLSASSLDERGPMMGAVHGWLRAHAPRWTVLRPSWFMQNFTTQHLPSIIGEGRIYSATQGGCVPFIDAANTHLRRGGARDHRGERPCGASSPPLGRRADGSLPRLRHVSPLRFGSCRHGRCHRAWRRGSDDR